MDYKEYFKGKKVTMLGLGLLGRGVNVARFLAECGAILTITDLKTEKELAPSIKQLKKYKGLTFILGRHRLSDFREANIVIKAAGVPLDSPYINEARKHKISVLMDASLFAKLAPKEVKIIGVTGTRGKSTVVHLIHHILSRKKYKGPTFINSAVFLGGNVCGMATLPLLKKVKAGDIVVLELDSWQLQGFGDTRTSPHIAVFTTFMRDHMNYYKGNMQQYFNDKANIFKHQKKNDTLIVGSQAKKSLSHNPFQGLPLERVVVVVNEKDLPMSWQLHIPGVHNRYNAALAIAACRALGIAEKDIKKGVESFPGVPGRLELVRVAGGVKYYNDTTATTPDGLMAALRALGSKKHGIVLIAGGNDKELVYKDAAKLIDKTVKTLVLIKGTATEKMLRELPRRAAYPVYIVGSMKEAVAAAQKNAQKGDTVLLSPGAASFGVFKNEFDRGDQFVKIVKSL
ncbi:MAG: UDP-N-acetylmuramoyl-L-alanine--D-glutamate ligase [Patescibacteria group bacterium]